MLEALPQIWTFLQSLFIDFWVLIVGSSVLSGFLALAVLDRMFHIFDIIRR